MKSLDTALREAVFFLEVGYGVLHASVVADFEVELLFQVTELGDSVSILSSELMPF